MDRYAFDTGTVDVYRAWTPREVWAAVREILDHRTGGAVPRPLPADKQASILVKPNLNNDLAALTGNSTDLRVLCALLEGLTDLGYRNVTVADGPNVGVERRNIDVFRRLRLDRLRSRYGIRIADLNREPGRRVPLTGQAAPEIAACVLDSQFIISVPTVKTHAEAGLSCACKNWVGICRAQDKRHMHLDLARNIARIATLVPPHLIIVDGLVGMEGNGPGDGEPVRLGFVAASDDPWLNDLVVARLIRFPWRSVGYLAEGLKAGSFREDTAIEVERRVPSLTEIRPAPPRSRLAILSESPQLMWLKKLVRPIVSRPAVTELAYRAKIVQDVYSPKDDTISALVRDPAACGDCRRCEEFCPTGLTLEQIGLEQPSNDCIECLYCWWVCPKEAITLTGELNAMERQVHRYKRAVERL